MALPSRQGRQGPTELEQLDHLADRFGHGLRPDFGPLAERSHGPRALDAALEVPYYSLLHSGNVVPRTAIAQRGRLLGVIALNVGVTGMDAPQMIAHAQTLARVLMAEYDAFGAVYSIQQLEWDETSGEGTLAIEVATGRGIGDSLASVHDGDLTPVLEALLAAVRPAETAMAITRDPVDLRDDPASRWRWIHPVRPQLHLEEFGELHRAMAFEVLSALVQVPDHAIRPLTSVPSCYVDLPGLDSAG